MPFTETELKRHLKEALPRGSYLLYGREPYLTSHYADQVVRLAMGRTPGRIRSASSIFSVSTARTALGMPSRRRQRLCL